MRRDGAASERIAERWLSTAGTSRAFLFLHLDEPHAPYTPPPPFDRFSSPYDGEIAYADEIVGRLISYLKKQQLYDQSTIILVADHGESLGAHGEEQHGLFVYDDTIRVPLIIKQAAGEGAGRRVRDLVQQVDLVPTILDLVRAPVPGNLRGRSLKPLLEGRETPRACSSTRSRCSRVISSAGALSPSVTDGRYRYISAPTAELYDLEADPRARTNLAETQPREAARLAAELKKIVAEPLSEQREPADLVLKIVSASWRSDFSVHTPDDPVRSTPTIDPKAKVDVAEAYRAAMAMSPARRWTLRARAAACHRSRRARDGGCVGGARHGRRASRSIRHGGRGLPPGDCGRARRRGRTHRVWPARCCVHAGSTRHASRRNRPLMVADGADKSRQSADERAARPDCAGVSRSGQRAGPGAASARVRSDLTGAVVCRRSPAV